MIWETDGQKSELIMDIILEFDRVDEEKNTQNKTRFIKTETKRWNIAKNKSVTIKCV